MSELEKALERVRPRWVFEPDGDQTDVDMSIIDAARRWLSLTSPETIEKAVIAVAKLHVDPLAPRFTQERQLEEARMYVNEVLAVLRSVKEGTQ